MGMEIALAAMVMAMLVRKSAQLVMEKKYAQTAMEKGISIYPNDEVL